ncbi:MAG TPA: GerMN domain-containing protein [Candidatus Atribacteria bacterium]|nr:GerMN domain-containing protein [Candidatus Atribacteria bacterium]HPT77676.1 GerMN domain-containing protein [Candidatus Atribacteria bacterium]
MGYIKKLTVITAAVLLAVALTGCSMLSGQRSNDRKSPGPNSPVPIDPNAQSNETEITLYFKHELADYLVPEKRTVVQENQSIEHLIVEELLKGPKKHERRLVMPPDTDIINVSRQGDTVFVNLTNNFVGNINLADLPGKENVAEADKPAVQANMKRLAIYSIVNSLTYLDGVNQVKLLVGNRQMSYKEMGAERLLQDQGGSLTPDSPMLAIGRNQNANLTPSRTVRLVMNALRVEPDWNFIYKFLSDKTMDGSTLPSLDELKTKIPSVVGGLIEFEDNPVIEEEYLGNKAFVTVHYINKADGSRKEVREVLTVDYVDGIWKVRLPVFLNQYR